MHISAHLHVSLVSPPRRRRPHVTFRCSDTSTSPSRLMVVYADHASLDTERQAHGTPSSNVGSVTFFAKEALEAKPQQELTTQSLYFEYERYCLEDLQLLEAPVRNITFIRTILGFFEQGGEGYNASTPVYKKTSRIGNKLIGLQYKTNYLLAHPHIKFGEPRKPAPKPKGAAAKRKQLTTEILGLKNEIRALHATQMGAEADAAVVDIIRNAEKALQKKYDRLKELFNE